MLGVMVQRHRVTYILLLVTDSICIIHNSVLSETRSSGVLNETLSQTKKTNENCICEEPTDYIFCFFSKLNLMLIGLYNN